MTRSVVFDVDGVLIHGFHARPDLRDDWDAKLRDMGIDAEGFQTDFIFDIFLKKVIIGETAMIEALDRRLPGLGYKGSSMAFAQFWLEHDSQINTALLETIRKLKATGEVRLFLATNQDHMRAQWLWQTAGLSTMFEDIFYSARAGVTKPHKDFFAFAEARMGTQSEPPLFDDTPKVIAGAKAYGWEAIQYETDADVLDHPWIREHL